ncbi:MAG: HAMP domain-containing histidine kinase [Nitrospirae bacterium]|jgi:signal transduction histidine kinase|nr:HAMP domain-containing histidine kinase [Nitrospirota bacterium]
MDLRRPTPAPDTSGSGVSRDSGRNGTGTFALILLLLAAIFLFDAQTPQSLVASILLDIPIALTGLILRPKLTFLVVLLSILANILAGVIDAHHEGSVNSIAVINRLFTTVSLILVGYLTLSIQKEALRQGQAESERVRANREARIRELFAELSHSPDPSVFLDRLSTRLQSLLSARGIILAFSDGKNWRLSPVRTPPDLWFWEEDDPLPGHLALRTEQPFLPAPMDPISLSPLLDANGVPRGIMGRLSLPTPKEKEIRLPPYLHLFVLGAEEPESAAILRDIGPVMEATLVRVALLSDLRSSIETLKNRNSLIEDLIRGVSHDIRTPLIAAGLTLNLAREGAFGSPPPELARALDQIRRSNDALLELANHLLFLSRAETGSFPDNGECVDLPDLIRDVLGALSPLLQEKRLSVQTRTEPSVVAGDAPSLRRLLTNLLDNAIKYSPIGETIHVCCEEREGLATVRIRDNGRGISEDVLAGLFERFRKDKDGSGFGLGLYIARQIARQHRGSLRWVPGPAGTTFELTLPSKGEDVS